MKTPLVLLHGFSGTPRSFAPILPALEAEHDVLAITLAGHSGGAPLADGVEPSPGALVDAVERDLDAAGIETAHLVGNSLGGWIAFELAARGRARSVVALAPAGGWDQSGPEIKRLRRLFRRNHRALQLGDRAFQGIARRPRARALALRDVAVHAERMSPDLALELMRGAAGCAIYLPFVENIHRNRFPERLEAIDAPVRIVWGTRDRITRLKSCTARFRTLIPDAEWVELEGLGHCPQFDDPDLVAAKVLEVTRRVDAQASSAVASA